MGRHLVACAALAALLSALSACRSAEPRDDDEIIVMADKGPCWKQPGCEACYTSEIDRSMHRMHDELSPASGCPCCGR